MARCVKNTLELLQKFRNVNIPAPTSGMYFTQNMFTLTFLTQLPYYTIVPTNDIYRTSAWY
jgi:hypothetical protein